MANIPDLTQTITDGALGITLPTDKSCAVIGVCTSGTANTVNAVTDLSTLKASFTSGPAVELAAHILGVAGGTVYLVPITASVAGTNSAVTAVGTSTAVATLTGAPRDSYIAKITVQRGASNLAAALATIKYTVDNGNTLSGEIAIPTSGIYAIPGTNVTVTWADGTFVAGDTFSFTSTAPGYSNTDLTNAWNALVADPRVWKFCAIPGAASTASAQATMAGVLDGLLTTAQNNFRFAYAQIGMPDGGDGTAGDAAAIAAFNSFASSRICVCAGMAGVVSSLTGFVRRTQSLLPHAARRQLASIHEDSGRVLSGSLPGVVALYRDEQINRGLDAARFVTLRTIIGKQGFYITQGNMMAAAGSDYSLVQRRETMDVACTVGRAAFIQFLNDSVRVNPSTASPASGQPGSPGTILEQDARNLETYVLGLLRAAILAPGHASDLTFAVNRTDNILSTSDIRSKVRVLPLAYAKFLEMDLGFTNPALQLS